MHARGDFNDPAGALNVVDGGSGGRDIRGISDNNNNILPVFLKHIIMIT